MRRVGGGRAGTRVPVTDYHETAPGTRNELTKELLPLIDERAVVGVTVGSPVKFIPNCQFEEALDIRREI